MSTENRLIRVLIVEDEPAAAEALALHVGRVPGYGVAGRVGTGADAAPRTGFEARPGSAARAGTGTASGAGGPTASGARRPTASGARGSRSSAGGSGTAPDTAASIVQPRTLGPGERRALVGLVPQSAAAEIGTKRG